MSPDDATRAIDFKVLQISSDDIPENGLLPSKFSGDGGNINPSISVQHIPQEARSLVIVMLDEKGTVYWLAGNIPVTHFIKQNESHGTMGKNSFGHLHYDGPKKFTGPAGLIVKVYALKSVLNIHAGAPLAEWEKAMCDDILAFGSFTFNYQP